LHVNGFIKGGLVQPGFDRWGQTRDLARCFFQPNKKGFFALSGKVFFLVAGKST
jgi:hypothetical protein